MDDDGNKIKSKDNIIKVSNVDVPFNGGLTQIFKHEFRFKDQYKRYSFNKVESQLIVYDCDYHEEIQRFSCKD